VKKKQTGVNPRNFLLDGVHIQTEMGTFGGDICQPIVIYLQMTACTRPAQALFTVSVSSAYGRDG